MCKEWHAELQEGRLYRRRFAMISNLEVHPFGQDEDGKWRLI